MMHLTDISLINNPINPIITKSVLPLPITILIYFEGPSFLVEHVERLDINIDVEIGY